MAEVIIYRHLYNKKHGTYYIDTGPVAADLPIQRRKTANAFSGISLFLALTGLALLLISFAPPALAWSKDIFQANIGSYKPSKTEIVLSQAPHTKPKYLPPYDANLSIENRLIIPTIGVTTVLQEATLDNYEAALKKGVWRVSDFGSPPDREKPTILAAHRYGYLFWSDAYRRENSFYNLPRLKVGDTVEIDYQQRKYLYEVYAEGKGPEILDYSADLILYTCESITGDTRIFKYARLITL